MKPLRCLILADDMTGGGDTGAQFAKKRLRTLLVTAGASRRLPLDDNRWPVLVVNTHSRAMAAEQARRHVAEFLGQLELERFGVLYKKIDSTLRGNIGAEIDATLEAMGHPVALLTPAYPEMGRTVENGVLKVRGVPVAKTEAARDPVCPVTDSRVVNLLRCQTPQRVGLIEHGHVTAAPAALLAAVEHKILEGYRLLVFDCLERRDLAAIANLGFTLNPMPLFIGSAGLAEAVAEQVSARAKGRSAARPPVKPAAHVLVVCGSASEVSRRQLTRLGQELDIPRVEIRPSFACRLSSLGGSAKRTIFRTIADALKTGSVILSVSGERLDGPGGAQRETALVVSEALGIVTRKVFSLSGIEAGDAAVLLTGGDTAMAVLQALGADGVEIGSEPIDGIMAGRARGGLCSGAQVITKAGAFGGDDALLRVARMLTG
ncbi:MAG: four-carbon acid sugar kinase family protein [Desulfobacterales bacterium]